jgi:hypothetical protein
MDPEPIIQTSSLMFTWGLVLLPGFQKGRDIKASEGKGQGAVLAKKCLSEAVGM